MTTCYRCKFYAGTKRAGKCHKQTLKARPISEPSRSRKCYIPAVEVHENGLRKVGFSLYCKHLTLVRDMKYGEIYVLRSEKYHEVFISHLKANVCDRCYEYAQITREMEVTRESSLERRSLRRSIREMFRMLVELQRAGGLGRIQENPFGQYGVGQVNKIIVEVEHEKIPIFAAQRQIFDEYERRFADIGADSTLNYAERNADPLLMQVWGAICRKCGLFLQNGECGYFREPTRKVQRFFHQLTKYISASSENSRLFPPLTRLFICPIAGSGIEQSELLALLREIYHAIKSPDTRAQEIFRLIHTFERGHFSLPNGFSLLK